MNRYADTINQIITHGKKRYETIYYPDFPLQDTDIYIITKLSDRLDLLAEEYYNDPRFWWIICKANALKKGTLRVEPGLKIRIPYPLDDFDVITAIKQFNF
jgi:hypothetical protein